MPPPFQFPMQSFLPWNWGQGQSTITPVTPQAITPVTPQGLGGIGPVVPEVPPVFTPYEEMPQDFSPYTQYLAQAGLLGAPVAQPGTRFARGLYDPLRSVFDIQGRFGADVGMPAAAWQGLDDAPSYLSGFRGPGGTYRGLQGSIYGRAAELLSGLYGMGGEERGVSGFGFSPSYDEYGQPIEGSYLSPGMQQNLLALGLAGQWGPRAARTFSGRLPRMRELYQERRAAGQAGGFNNFLDWLSDRYNLGEFFGTQVDTAPVTPTIPVSPPSLGGGVGGGSTAGGALPQPVTIAPAPPPALAPAPAPLPVASLAPAPAPFVPEPPYFEPPYFPGSTAGGALPQLGTFNPSAQAPAPPTASVWPVVPGDPFFRPGMAPWMYDRASV
jgi:hypothetical protein